MGASNVWWACCKRARFLGCQAFGKKHGKLEDFLEASGESFVLHGDGSGSTQVLLVTGHGDGSAESQPPGETGNPAADEAEDGEKVKVCSVSGYPHPP